MRFTGSLFSLGLSGSCFTTLCPSASRYTGLATSSNNGAPSVLLPNCACTFPLRGGGRLHNPANRCMRRMPLGQEGPGSGQVVVGVVSGGRDTRGDATGRMRGDDRP